MIRWIAIFIIGFIMTYILPDSFTGTDSLVIDVLLRVGIALLFVLLTWLVQQKKKKNE